MKLNPMCRRAKVYTSKGYMIVMVVGARGDHWRVMRPRGALNVFRPSGRFLGPRETMLVPAYALKFMRERKR